MAGKDSYRRADYFRTAADSNVFCANAVAARAIAVSAWRGGWRTAASRSETLLVYNSTTNQIAGHIRLQPIFRDIGNVTGPLMGAAISADYGFRAVYSASRQAWCCSMLSIHGAAYDGADWQ